MSLYTNLYGSLQILRTCSLSVVYEVLFAIDGQLFSLSRFLLDKYCLPTRLVCIQVLLRGHEEQKVYRQGRQE